MAPAMIFTLKLAVFVSASVLVLKLLPVLLRQIAIRLENTRSPGFEDKAMKYFAEKVPAGHLQRIDGVRCFSPIGDYAFLQHRLDRLAKKGQIDRRVIGSIWRSCRNMPSYGPRRGSGTA